MKSKLMPTVVLSTICIVVALLLSVINIFTGPVIKAANDAAANAALLEVFPDGEGFVKTEDLSVYNLPEELKNVVVSVYEEKSGGYVFQTKGTGRNGEMQVMCGVDAEGRITGTKCIIDAETPDYSNKVFEEADVDIDGNSMGVYAGMSSADFTPHIVNGSTLTSNGYADAVKAALDAFTVIGGGTVDLRTPEQILSDNCNAALGTEDVVFSEGFVWSELEGVEGIYLSDAGSVILVGETYVGINTDGSIVTEGISDEDAAKATAAHGKYAALTSVDFSAHSNINKRIVKNIYNTDSGVYLFELEAAGYSVMAPGYAHTSQTRIKIYLVIDSEGKIDYTKTISHDESEGYGEKCELPEYYEQFNGLTAGDIVIIEDGSSETSEAPGVIAGATLTSRGYQQAVAEAFNAYNILKGVTASE